MGDAIGRTGIRRLGLEWNSEPAASWKNNKPDQNIKTSMLCVITFMMIILNICVIPSPKKIPSPKHFNEWLGVCSLRLPLPERPPNNYAE
jgi:hypothetical protein